MTTDYKIPPSRKPKLPPLRFATWNLENFGDKRDLHAEKTQRIAHTIVHTLNTPHVLAVQEMCDDSGKADDGVTSAKKNAQDLIDAIQEISGVDYRYTEIAPQNNQDGGKPGSNIRCGYFYRPDRVKLAPASGETRDGALFTTINNNLQLTKNPCSIGVDDPAFIESRKPLLTHFIDVKTNEDYFMINTHLASDGGFRRFRAANPGVEADTYPPQREQQQLTAQTSQLGIAASAFQPNQQRLEQRIAQARILADISSKLYEQITAHNNSDNQHVVVLGDFNTSTDVSNNGVPEPRPKPEVLSVLEKSGLINLAHDLGNVHPSHRHDNLSMTLDYIYASQPLAKRIAQVSRPVVNEGDWASRVSDHNPTIISIHAPARAIIPTCATTIQR